MGLCIGGIIFAGPFAQPFRGQSTGIAPWKDGSLLVVLWYQQGGVNGVRYVRLVRE